MTQQTAQAAGTAVREASASMAATPDASSDPMWRKRTAYALVLVAFILLTVISLVWDGLASYDAMTPGAPHGALDAEQ